jgi:histidine triad (HIT) family protein
MACTFCRIVAGESPASVVTDDEHCISLLDLYPAVRGHTLVVARRHVPLLGDLSDAETAAMLRQASRLTVAMRDGGFGDDAHVLVNDGPAANQTVAHAHAHVVPRRKGDLVSLTVRLSALAQGKKFEEVAREQLDRDAAVLREHLP